MSIGSGNGLVQIGQQAIIWTNVDPVFTDIYAALGGDELTKQVESFPMNTLLAIQRNVMNSHQLIIRKNLVLEILLDTIGGQLNYEWYLYK